MAIKLNVPSSEDDKVVKVLGAKQDKENNHWYVPDELCPDLFSKWLPGENINIIARNPFYVAVGSRSCWKCNRLISVISFCSSNFMALEEDEHDDDLDDDMDDEYTAEWIT